VSLLRTMLRAMGSPLGKALYRIPTPPVTTVALPDYPIQLSIGTPTASRPSSRREPQA
jgi:hypothetical protein